MRCVADAMRSLIDLARTHHIRRLMALGQFALLAGVHPYRLHEWHMAMYVDAIDWVSLPKALGMSQFGDGGVIGTKTYCASRMARTRARSRRSTATPLRATATASRPTTAWAFS